MLLENKEWYKKYRYDIFVFYFNGQFLMKYRVDLKVFYQRLVDIENKIGQKMIYRQFLLKEFVFKILNFEYIYDCEVFVIYD